MRRQQWAFLLKIKKKSYFPVAGI